MIRNEVETMLGFSQKVYGKLLADTVPGVIADDKEYGRIESIFNGLMDKGEDKLSPEETRLFALLAKLLEEYEANADFDWDEKETTPAEALHALMEYNDLKQADLVDIFGSQPAVSRALNGTRKIGIEQAKGLAARFKVSVGLFL